MDKIKDFVKRIHIVEWAGACFSLIVGVMLMVYNIGFYERVAGLDSGNYDLHTLGRDTMTFTADFLSIFIGVLLIIAGAGFLAYLFVSKRDFFNVSAVLGSLLIALGIFSIAASFGFQIILIFTSASPYILIVLGSVILIDGLYDLILGVTGESGITILSIVEIIISIVAIILGILFLAIDALNNSMELLLGIFLIILAVMIVLNMFLHFSDKMGALKSTLTGKISLGEKKTEKSTEDAGDESPSGEDGEQSENQDEVESRTEEE